MSELSLVPIEELLDEINKRYEHWVFSGVQTNIGGIDKIFTMRKWGGNSHTCVGLCGMLTVVITDGHLQKNELEEGDATP